MDISKGVETVNLYSARIDFRRQNLTSVDTGTRSAAYGKLFLLRYGAVQPDIVYIFIYILIFTIFIYLHTIIDYTNIRLSSTMSQQE